MNFQWLLILTLVSVSAHAAPTASEPLHPAPEPFVHVLPTPRLATKLSAASETVANNTSSIINTAMGTLGIRYRFGGTNAHTGFDCSGLVRAIYQDAVGYLLPRKASEQAKATQKINKKDLQPGDLVFFNTMRRAFSHVGIYVGEGKFIHAPRTGKQVRVDRLDAHYWSKRFNGARRVHYVVASSSHAPY